MRQSSVGVAWFSSGDYNLSGHYLEPAFYQYPRKPRSLNEHRSLFSTDTLEKPRSLNEHRSLFRTVIIKPHTAVFLSPLMMTHLSCLVLKGHKCTYWFLPVFEVFSRVSHVNNAKHRNMGDLRPLTCIFRHKVQNFVVLERRHSSQLENLECGGSWGVNLWKTD